MINRDLIKTALSHRETDMVPFNFMFTPPIRIALEKHYGVPVEEKLNLPIRMNGLKSIKPLYAFPEDYGETIKDEYGVVWTTSKIDRGTPIIPCCPEPNLSSYEFPNPASEYRFENMGDWCLKNKNNYTVVPIGDLWERATFMRGMENILMDIVLNQEFVEELLRGITDYILQTMKILFNRFQFDGIFISDDYGTQKALVMSPDYWRRFIKPLLKEIYTFAKSNGRIVFHHSCGNIYPIIGDMIDIGLDILHPIQPEAMDIFKLKKEFGKCLTFCGGLKTQQLLPYGTPEDIRNEVKILKREMGRGGGYILEPGITLQSDVPLENLITLIDATIGK
ncbi:MAG: uroporphyrinogen decarboxylase family protein [Elusimicrobia bacterium]|nr:uroporphyrinogen decarboxylase family protein [Elusimicrobiota bacterium]